MVTRLDTKQFLLHRALFAAAFILVVCAGWYVLQVRQQAAVNAAAKHTITLESEN